MCRKICGVEVCMRAFEREMAIWHLCEYIEDTITVNMAVYMSRATNAPIMHMQTYQNLITGFILYIIIIPTIIYIFFIRKWNWARFLPTHYIQTEAYEATVTVSIPWLVSDFCENFDVESWRKCISSK